MRRIFSILLLALAVAAVALGVWQVRRGLWKKELIASARRGSTAPPIEVAQVPRGPLTGLAYRRIRLTGRYLPQGTAFSAATTIAGSGYWVMVPLDTGKGRRVYINRGFVPADAQIEAVRTRVPQTPVVVVGLLRLSETRSFWPRLNRPADDRWYARNVGALAQRHGLGGVDPRYFVDSQSEVPHPIDGPRPGLMSLAFSDNHSIYAVTWFALALLAAVGAVLVWRAPVRLTRASGGQ